MIKKVRERSKPAWKSENLRCKTLVLTSDRSNYQWHQFQRPPAWYPVALFYKNVVDRQFEMWTILAIFLLPKSLYTKVLVQIFSWWFCWQILFFSIWPTNFWRKDVRRPREKWWTMKLISLLCWLVYAYHFKKLCKFQSVNLWGISPSLWPSYHL